MQDIFFDGLAAPLRLKQAGQVRSLLPEVAPGWPHVVRAADPELPPFFTIRAQPGTALFHTENHLEPAPPRPMDALNAACDAMAGLALALPAEDAGVICLHAAGVAMAGRLVVFPNVRRAGKSTLSAALAHRGYPVFSDDVLPLSFPDGGPVLARSMGIAPRLRLPLPERASPDFRDWVAANPGPENRQYKYLRLPGQPARGEALPVGAFVILDRQEEPGTARLDPVPADAAMDALLHQNFTRDRHSGDILAEMARALGGLPLFRLRYSGLEDAVACLADAFARWPGPVPGAGGPPRIFRLARFDAVPAAPGPRLVQRPGTIAREIGATLYLADAEGRAIHRMDPLAAAIWEMLAEPASPEEIAALLAEAFPDTDPARLRADLGRLLEGLAGQGLLA